MYNPYVAINSTDITVPSKFTGIQWSGYPNGGSGPTTIPPIIAKTTYNNSYRSLANGPADWQQIETSQGVYNWTALDEWVAANYANGTDICYSTPYMPYFYSANPAVQSIASGVGYLGTCGPLTSLGRTGYANFTTALVMRYKNLGTPIKYWQCWEEPFDSIITTVNLPLTSSQVVSSTTILMTDTTGITVGMGISHAKVPANTWVVTVNSGVSVIMSNASISAILTTDGNLAFAKGTGNWWGTKADLVDLAYAGYVAAKAADPNITVLSPSVSPPADTLTSWWGVAGTANPGVVGYQTCDWFGVDLYGYWSSNFPFGLDTYTASNASEVYRTSISSILATLRTQMGANIKPVAITSYGFGYLGNSPASAYFRNSTSAYRKQQFGRLLLESAANGVKFVIAYSGDSWNYYGGGGIWLWSGDFVNDTNGVIAAYNEFNANIAGKTIKSCGYLSDGTLTATLSDKSIYTI